MARKAALGKNQMAERLAGVFCDYGYDGASLTLLADATNLSRASLYHHFPAGKQDMAACALGYSGMQFQKLILAPLMKTGGKATRQQARDQTARQQARDQTARQQAGTAALTSLRGVLHYYPGERPVCLMNILSLGSASALFGAQIKAAVGAWRAALARVLTVCGLKDAEASAEAMIVSIQGALVLSRVLASREPLETAIEKTIQQITTEIDMLST